MASLETLRDDFEDPAVSATKWTSTGTVAYTGGKAVLTGTSGGSMITSAGTYGFGTAQAADRTYFLAKITPNLSGSDNFALVVYDTASNMTVMLEVIGGTLYRRGYNTSGGVLFNNAIATYNSTTMAWLRIRAGISVINTEYSTDGVTWTTYSASVTFGASTGMRGQIVNYSTSPATTVTVDNVNLPAQYTTITTGITDGETLSPGTPSIPTPKIDALVDDFTGVTLDPALWTTAVVGDAITVSVGEGNLKFTTVTATAGRDQNASVTTVGNYDLTNSSVHAYVSMYAATTNTTSLTITCLNNAEQFLIFRPLASSNLTFRGFNAAGTQIITTNVAYNATTMAWWRIRHTATVVYWETAPADIGPWTVRTQATYTPTNFQYRLALTYAWNTNNAVVPGVTRFDNINNLPSYSVYDPDTLGLPTAAGLGPPLGSLTDDFATALDLSKWTPVTPAGTTVATAAGQLEINIAAGTLGPFTAAATTVDLYNLTNSGISGKITVGASTTNITGIYLRNPSNPLEYVAMLKTSNTVYCRVYDTTGTQVLNASVVYGLPAMTWWRILHNGTSINWDTSVDGVTWTNRATVAYTPTTRALAAALEFGWNAASNSVASVARFDNINTLLVLRPAGVADAETVDGPALTEGGAATTNPDPIGDTETLDGPTLSLGEDTAPDPHADPETLDGPDLFYIPGATTPDNLTDAEQLDGPDVGYTPVATPDELADSELLDEPTLAGAEGGEPDHLKDAENVDQPTIGFQAALISADHTDPETLATPAVIYHPSIVNPDSLIHTGTVGTPDLSYISVYSGAYSTGTYGVGPYQGLYFAPDGILDPTDLGLPDIWSVPPVDPNTILLTEIVDPEQLGFPQAPTPNATNYNYGAGVYNTGPYYGSPSTPSNTNPTPNLSYSIGTYGYGIYYGVTPPPPPAQSIPPINNIAGRTKPPLHILGIGPWSPLIQWRGAPNYGINPGQHPARPAMALPPATSKGFTLRLNDGGEARVDLAFPRSSAVIMDEMDTDLWWRRKDPRTGRLEMIGRFNTSHLSIATSDTGVTCNAQLVDYRTILGERMVLRYLSPGADPPTSMWDKGHPIMDIIDWALPHNTRLDLTEVRGDSPYNLGKTTQPFHLPPGTLIADLMDNLEAVSPNTWEWWIETPTDINKAPKLRFTLGQRGQDRGVVLFDHGSGPTPIAAWTRNGAADDYANSIYYTGGGTGTGKDAGGGVVEQIDAQVLQYGQRDAQDGNSSISGNIALIRKRATKKLMKLADRRPNYDIRLKQGFWRGLEHINIGDTITLILRMGEDLLHDKYRVSEITVDIDDNGLEDVSLTLGRLPTSADPRSKRSPTARILRYLKNYQAPDGSTDVITPDPD